MERKQSGLRRTDVKKNVLSSIELRAQQRARLPIARPMLR